MPKPIAMVHAGAASVRSSRSNQTPSTNQRSSRKYCTRHEPASTRWSASSSASNALHYDARKPRKTAVPSSLSHSASSWSNPSTRPRDNGIKFSRASVEADAMTAFYIDLRKSWREPRKRASGQRGRKRCWLLTNTAVHRGPRSDFRAIDRRSIHRYDLHRGPLASTSAGSSERARERSGRAGTQQAPGRRLNITARQGGRKAQEQAARSRHPPSTMSQVRPAISPARRPALTDSRMISRLRCGWRVEPA